MKKVSLDVWIQLIGMLGVLGGLLFVGLEMRQSQLIAIGAQQQARAELSAQILIAPFEGNYGRASQLVRFSCIPIPLRNYLRLICLSTLIVFRK